MNNLKIKIEIEPEKVLIPDLPVKEKIIHSLWLPDKTSLADMLIIIDKFYKDIDSDSLLVKNKANSVISKLQKITGCQEQGDIKNFIQGEW